jgi:hypothetical protein
LTIAIIKIFPNGKSMTASSIEPDKLSNNGRSLCTIPPGLPRMRRKVLSVIVAMRLKATTPVKPRRLNQPREKMVNCIATVTKRKRISPRNIARKMAMGRTNSVKTDRRRSSLLAA